MLSLCLPSLADVRRKERSTKPAQARLSTATALVRVAQRLFDRCPGLGDHDVDGLASRESEATASSGQPTDSEPRHTRRRRRVLHDPTPRLHDRAVALGRARPVRRQLGRALEPAVDDHARAGLAGSLLFSSGGIGTLRKLTHVAQGAHHWDLREHKPEHDQPACACTGEEISPQTPRQRTPVLTNPVQTTAHPRRARRSQAPRPPPRCSRLPWEPGASWRRPRHRPPPTCAAHLTRATKQSQHTPR